ncbi:hypothetical protein GCM10009801_43450 [Streptomyces albiaxialis]|uniref:Peptidase M14 domain-containing protein n=1 Tax=Streptomyces albiaxialis TaxID=329523 RepID=A0ABN2W3Y6_9ACTN
MPAIPTPESVIGWTPCADHKIATYEQIARYCRELARASDRMRLVEIGRTEQGRPQLMAIVSAAENLSALERYRRISARLAGVKGMTDAEARELARAGRGIAWVDFGIHASEIATHQSAPTFLYELTADDSPTTERIRQELITLVVPAANPDGTTMVADWYTHRFTAGLPEFPYPWLDGAYAGHDNNRDWYMCALAETRNISHQLYHRWFPQVINNVHQTSAYPPRIVVPPFLDPVNPNIPAEVIRNVNYVGAAVARSLERAGMPGVVSHQYYDGWWNGGMRSVPQFHNITAILTETARTSAGPEIHRSSSFPETFPDNITPTRQPSTFYPNPYRGGEWRMRDAGEYLRAAAMAVLDLVARDREEWLYDACAIGRRQIRKGGDDCYVLPADQPDFPTAVKLVNILRHQGVAVEQAGAGFTLDDVCYPAGSFVIRAGQAYRPIIEDLLCPQRYPDRGSNGQHKRPFDITGWTLPLQMGVTVTRHRHGGHLPRTPVAWARPRPDMVTDEPAGGFALDPRVNDVHRAVNELLRAGFPVLRAPGDLPGSRGGLPPGAFLAGPEAGTILRDLGDRLGVPVASVAAVPTDAVPVASPRLGVYKQVGNRNYDEGWTRLVLDQFGFEYRAVLDREIREGGLGARYDTVILPDSDWASMRDGPPADRCPPELAGGMTPGGVANLREFVADGGTLITLNRAATLPLAEFGLPVRDITETVSSDDLSVPGTIVEMAAEGDHPVCYGMPPVYSAFVLNSPVFLAEGPGVRIAARYPDRDVLRSGWLRGESHLVGRASVLTVRHGLGNVVLIGFKAQHRAQSHGAFKILFNAIFLGSTSWPDPPSRSAARSNLPERKVPDDGED